MNKVLGLIVASVMLPLSGCLPYRQPTADFANLRSPDPADRYHDVRAEAAANPLYKIVPRNRKQIAWYDVPHWLSWALVGNEHDGIFGEDTNPPYTQTLNGKSFLAWQVRNPACNFCFFVIGSGDWKTHHSFTVLQADAVGTKGLKSEPHPSVFGKGQSAFIFAFNDYKPYVSVKFPVWKDRHTDFYLGWRPEGHFGVKFRPVKSNDS